MRSLLGQRLPVVRPSSLVLSCRRHPPVGKHVSNVAALLSGGRVQFIQQKMLLPFYDVFDEQRYFEPATSQSLTFVERSAGCNHHLRRCLER